MKSDFINKDRKLQELLRYLFEKYEKTKFKIQDYWESDNCAIGLVDFEERYLIYISTIGFENSGYYVALENPAKPNSELPYEPAGVFDNLNLDEVEKLFVNHLRINK